MRLVQILIATVLALLFLVTGCKQGNDPTRVIVPDQHLDATVSAEMLDEKQDGIPVLCYHYFSSRPFHQRIWRAAGAVLFGLPLVGDVDYWTTPAAQFEKQLDHLVDNGYRTLRLDDLVSIAAGRMEPPPRAVVLTFDDAALSVYEVAAPLLAERGLSGVLFLVDGWLEQAKFDGIELMNWQQVRELHERGVLTPESHTSNLHDKSEWEGYFYPSVEVMSWREDPAELDRLGADLERSREVIAAKTGHDARFIAWPYGGSTARADSVARSIGYAGTFGLRAGRVNRDEGDALSMPRYAITARTSLTFFRRLLGER